MDPTIEINASTKNYKHVIIYPGLDSPMDIIDALMAEKPIIPLPLPGSTIYERMHSFFWKGKGNYVWSVSKSNPQVLEGFDLSIETDYVLNLTKGLKLNVIADINGAVVQSKHERERDNKQHVRVINSLAMVTKSPLMKMAANLFLKINKPIYPAYIFNKVESAKEWIHPYTLNSDSALID